MTETSYISQNPKNGDKRPKENPSQTFLNGTWYNSNDLKNLLLQKKYRNFVSCK